MTGTPRQQEAITSHDSSVVVCAGAGTGKTYVLVNKYLDSSREIRCRRAGTKKRLSVLDILALTFTDKAAAEMKERIRVELEKKEGDFWERARLEFLIAPVQTFHSFCSGVLREFPWKPGLNPPLWFLTSGNPHGSSHSRSRNSSIPLPGETSMMPWSAPSPSSEPAIWRR